MSGAALHLIALELRAAKAVVTRGLQNSDTRNAKWQEVADKWFGEERCSIDGSATTSTHCSENS